MSSQENRAHSIVVTIEHCVECKNHLCREICWGQPPDVGVFCELRAETRTHETSLAKKAKTDRYLVGVSETPSSIQIPDDCPILLEQQALLDAHSADGSLLRHLQEYDAKFAATLPTNIAPARPH